MNKEIIPLLKEKELELLSMYHEAYGGGGSPTRQFKSFLLTGTRSKEGREIVASFRPAATVSGKETGEQQGSASPAQQQPQQTAKVPAQHKQRGEQPQGDQEGVADGNPFDVIKQDIETMSMTAVASKYTKEELTAYAESVGAAITEAMNEKQIVKAISNKANESKG
jgi:hypothetical protein